MSTDIRAAGVYDDVDDAEYFADKLSLSQSGAKRLLEPSVPAKFLDWLENPEEPTEAMEFGSVVHKLVLGKGADIAVLEPDVHGLKVDGSVADKPTATKTWRDAESQARAEGRIPIHIERFSKAQAMADEVFKHSLAGPLLTSPGKSEQSFYVRDPQTGVMLRGRTDRINFDFMGRLHIVDYKSALNASREKFSYVAKDLRYYLQFAWYTTLAKWSGLCEEPAFVFVVQEKKSPYLVNVIELDSEALDLGLRHMREAIDLYAKCMKANEWPGYDEVIHTVSLPLSAFPDEEIVI